MTYIAKATENEHTLTDMAQNLIAFRLQQWAINPSAAILANRRDGIYLNKTSLFFLYTFYSVSNKHTLQSCNKTRKKLVRLLSGKAESSQIDMR